MKKLCYRYFEKYEDKNSKEVKICEILKKMIYNGYGNFKSIKDLYRKVLGKDMNIQPPNCKIIKPDQILQTFNPIVNEIISKILDMGEKGYEDLISLWIVTYFSIMELQGLTKDSLILKYKGNKLESIKYKDKNKYITPSEMIQKTDDKPLQNNPINIKARNSISQSQIDNLRTNNNTTIPVHTFAKLLIYKLRTDSSV